MIGVAPAYPRVETPEGWTRETRGPRIWLVPPESGGRVVLAPLQARPKRLSPERFLEMVLLRERDNFARLKQSEPFPFTSRQKLPGLLADVAALDEGDEPIEWRCYAIVAAPELFALMFAQIAVARHREIRTAFVDIVKTATLPDDSSPGPLPTFEPWGEL